MPDKNGCPIWSDPQFRPFYTSQFVRDTFPRKCWTVTIPAEKKPIDIYMFQYRNRVVGAAEPKYPSLDSLDNVCHLIPNAVNNCMYLDALLDGYVVLDIEPTCPDDVRAELMTMPYEYAETSLSGKGLHMIFKVPACFSQYPVAQAKTVMREEHGWYEILLNHYITFTRNHIQPSKNPNGTGDFEKLFAGMCAQQKEVVRADVDIEQLEPEDIPQYDEIVGLLGRQTYQKTPQDFNNDYSKYEFGMIGFLRVKLAHILQVDWIKNSHQYTDSERAWLIYVVAREKLPYRAKHDQCRNQLPWLLWLAGESIAKEDKENPTGAKGKKG